MECASCGTANEQGQRFCLECGSPLAQGCPSCGQPVVPHAKFCGSCGTALAAAPDQPTRAPVAERRMCSVLFCDLVGFTPLSEVRDPEEVRELLSAYFETATTVIRRYGGVVEKFIGDAVMAVWGTPVATEGDAERAVRAAIDLMDTVDQLGTERGIAELAARAGVVTGEVAVTIGATNEGMVAGDAVNTAARVQSVADAGQVLVDATTRRLSANAIAFDEPVAHTLKGKAEPEPLWRATRVLSGVGGSQRVDGLEAPLTGRDAEMRTLRELFHAAVDRRVPRLVLVGGPAGVGKSRLGWEFEKYVDGLVHTVLWHRGRCLSYGEGVSFWALAEIVRQRFGIAEEDLPDAATAKLLAGVATWLPADERDYVGLRLARLLGVAHPADPGGPISQDELFAGWRLFFERMAAVQPVVVLVEDAHHADGGLLDFLDHLVDWVRDLPVFVVVLARTELEQHRPGFGSGRNRVGLTLDPLDPASMHGLVGALVPDIPASAAEAIVRQAQGLPLFAVETVRALVDRDVVQPVDGVYRLVGDLGELEVPDSLHALLAARLDALPATSRQLVADIAVLGTTFPEEAVVAVTGADPAWVHATLSELLRREVLDISADPLSPERGSYRFAQDMLRQVAYDTLSRRDRKSRHLAVAAHLRKAFANDGEEVADVVARHYLDALAAVPDDGDAPQLRGLAAGALVRAAERAERTGAPARACESFTRAAALADQDGDLVRRATMLQRAGLAAEAWGDFGTAAARLEAAAAAFSAAGDGRAEAVARSALGRALFLDDRDAEAREALTHAVAVLREQPDIDTAVAIGRLARLETFSGSPGADESTVEAVRLTEAFGAGPRTMSDALATRGVLLLHEERLTEAALHLQEAVRLAEQGGDHGQLLTHMSALATLRLGQGDPEGSLDVCRTGAALARRVGRRYHVAWMLHGTVAALIETGDWAEATALAAVGGELDGLGEAGFPWADIGRAAALALTGDTDGLASSMERLQRYRSVDDPQTLASLALVDGLLAVNRGDRAQALAAGRRAVAAADLVGMTLPPVRLGWAVAARAALELGDDAAVSDLLQLLERKATRPVPPLLLAEADLVRARVAARDGVAGAGEQLAAAVAQMRTVSPPQLLAGGLLDHAAYLLEQGDDAAAAVAVAEAREIGERLGCRPVLDRADRLSPQASAVPSPR